MKRGNACQCLMCRCFVRPACGTSLDNIRVAQFSCCLFVALKIYWKTWTKKWTRGILKYLGASMLRFPRAWKPPLPRLVSEVG